MSDGKHIFDELGARPSLSEENGLKLLTKDDLVIFSPGISSGGFAEIRMAQQNPQRKIIATTIDKEGLEFANDIIRKVAVKDQIEIKLEDLCGEWPYPENYFDFIYARLVLHFLAFNDLESVLSNFSKSTKTGGRLFVVVRSEKNLDENDPNSGYDQETHFTTRHQYDEMGNITWSSKRYFHTRESITEHLDKAGFIVHSINEYQEQLYRDFMRTDMSPVKDHVLEVVAKKI